LANAADPADVSPTALLQHALGGGPDLDDIEKLKELLRGVVDGAVLAANRMHVEKPRGGRPKDDEKAVLLQRLRSIEESLTGRLSIYTYRELNDAYDGRLFKMMRAFEDAIAKIHNREPLSDAAVAKYIHRQNWPHEG
jgi:hypothetical protein